MYAYLWLERCIYPLHGLFQEKKLKSHKIGIVSYLQSKNDINLNCNRQDSFILRSVVHGKATWSLALLKPDFFCSEEAMALDSG